MNTNVLITGANRGIGLEFCRQYAQSGAKVFAVCRSTSPDLERLSVQVIDGIDVSVRQQVAQLSDALKGTSINILINNAGILRNESLVAMDFDSMLQQFEVNTLGPLRVIDALQDQLADGAKVALITSRMGSISDNTSGGYYGYRMSKAALNAAGMSLARDFAGRGIAVAILHPGFVQTGMVNHAGDISAAEAAGRLIKRIGALNAENSGTFWHSNGEVLPW